MIRMMLSVLFLCFSLSAWSQCGYSKQEINQMLDSYIYDNSAEIKVTNSHRGQLHTLSFTVYKSPAYRFYFDRSKCDKDVEIRLYEYNKRKDEKTLVYESLNNDQDVKEIIEHGKRYIVEILVPPESNAGCISVVLGFKMKEDHLSKKKRKPRIVFK